MSKYRKVKTEFRNFSSLVAALRDLGYTDERLEIANCPTEPSLPLIGYMGDTRPERASIRIPRQYVGRAANDVGFAWDGKGFKAIISEFDSGHNFDEKKLAQLSQRYAFHEVRRQAKIRGYSVSEQPGQDGTIRLILARR